MQYLSYVGADGEAYNSIERNILEFWHRVDRHASRNPRDSTDEDGEELVEIVVLGNHDGEHHHLHASVLVFKIHVAN